MDRSQPPDAFSKTLESKPQHSHISQIKKQYTQDNESAEGGSTVNRLSRVFETNQFLDKQPKPIPPSKPPSLSKPSVSIKISPRPPPPPPSPPLPPPPPPQQQSQQSPPQQQPEIDQTHLAFKDIRARFQQDNALPIRNQQASLLYTFCFRDKLIICIIFRLNTEHPYH
jgi:hypothetical protein